MQQYDVTDAQKKAFEENEADFRRFDDQLRDIRETARARLTKTSWGPDRNDTIPCLSCPCPDFEPGGPQGKCKRVSCRHELGGHDLPT
jgi:hypothetical protein